ncbi:DUF5694 domain-containing protein [Pseudoteredinibacter isoporae]|uniref:DUF5694 domain-containing protein n=1 Tax=Pseudoteredinibacter isoporae TaxID=570281 RepID=UPI00333EEDF3
MKAKVIDVSERKNQTYLEELSLRIAEGFKPTQVLIECRKDQSVNVNEAYQRYLIDQHTLTINENEQLGFRVAKKASLKEVICYDEREISWQSTAVFSEIPNTSPEVGKEVENMIKSLTMEINELHKTETLKGILRYCNDSETEEQNKSLYLLLNEVGAFAGYSGADSTASWWHRNFRMYANIQKYAQKGNRVMVIGGVGHTSIIKDLIRLDSKRTEVKAESFL